MIKHRNLFMQVLLFIVTIGIYGIYWFYSTAKEMADRQKIDGSPGLWTVLLFIPIANLFAYWKYCELVDSVTDSKYPKILMFILFIVFSPLVWLLTQLELNKLASQTA